MDKKEILTAIILVSVLLLFLLAFLLLMIVIQRRKRNAYISEREHTRRLFDEQLLKSRLEMQELSFNAVSMEIHDNVGQTLSLLKVQLNIIDQQGTLDRAVLKEARASVSKVMSELRDLANNLNTQKVAITPLREMIQHALKRIENTGLLRVEFQFTGHEKEVNKDKKVILYRIIQECFQNIIKHAKASELKLTFLYHQECVFIEISDNGLGFDVARELEAAKGLGLSNIISRAEIIGGTAEIRSNTRFGTQILINTPYE